MNKKIVLIIGGLVLVAGVGYFLKKRKDNKSKVGSSVNEPTDLKTNLFLSKNSNNIKREKLVNSSVGRSKVEPTASVRSIVSNTFGTPSSSVFPINVSFSACNYNGKFITNTSGEIYFVDNCRKYIWLRRTGDYNIAFNKSRAFQLSNAEVSAIQIGISPITRE